MSSCIFCSGATRRAAPRPESFRGEGPARRRRGDGVTRCRPRRFHDDNHAILYRKIKAADYAFDPQYWDQVSDDAKDLIKKMLVVDPDKRSISASLGAFTPSTRLVSRNDGSGWSLVRC